MIEFGRPYVIPSELVAEYKKDRRVACQTLLDTCAEQMRSVITTAPDLDTLEALQLARRLYTPAGVTLTPRQFLELSRRLRQGFEMFKEKPEVQKLFHGLVAYKNGLQALGLNDRLIEEQSQLAGLEAAWLVALRFLLLIVLVVAALPASLLNAPIGLITRQVATKYALRAKASSAVKLRGWDVLASKKLTTAAALTPLFWTAYTLVFALWFAWSWKTVLAFCVAMPILSYVSLRLMEEGVAILKSFVALFRLKWDGSSMAELRAARLRLQDAIRLVVQELGPLLAQKQAEEAAKDTKDTKDTKDAAGKDFERWRIIKEVQPPPMSSLLSHPLSPGTARAIAAAGTPRPLGLAAQHRR
jgi:glycerol-3-phosphate O-acyltransferase/dihydroxyacetone phosphate acyltransferase